MQVVPYNVEAERSVLGSCLINRDAIQLVADWLQPTDFYIDRHQTIYAAMLALHERQTPPALPLLIQELRQRDQFDDVGGMGYLEELAEAPLTSYDIADYANVVKRTAKQRVLMQVGADITKLAANSQYDDAEQLKTAALDTFAAAVPEIVYAPTTDAQQEANSTTPKLPEWAAVDDALSAQACPWLDEYIAFSRYWSPRSYDGYHEACALWMLSTIAARRVALNFGGKRYTNLYIALVGRTSLWAKSTAAKIAIDTLHMAGLAPLLTPDDATPQAFITALSGRVPRDYGEMTAERQEALRNKLAFPAQRGWFFEEFGQKISSMMREGSVMADYRGLFRRLDDCPERYEVSTIGRGNDELDRPYLALLANLTPADMAPHARKNGALWSDGFFARFGFVTPPPDAQPMSDRFPRGERIIPASLIRPLRMWHDRLGVPSVRVKERTDDKGKGTGLYDAYTEPHLPTPLTLSNDVYEAFYRYDSALREIARASDNADLDGNYSRLGEKALRIAMLLASLEGSAVIEMRHWARAQQIAERWRANLHNLIEQLQSTNAASMASTLEDDVMRTIERLGAPTMRELRQRLKSASVEELERVLGSLERNGILVVETTRVHTKRYRVHPASRRKVETVDRRKNNNSSTVQGEDTNCRQKDQHFYSSTLPQFNGSTDLLRNLYAAKDLASIMQHCLDHGRDYIETLEVLEADAQRATKAQSSPTAKLEEMELTDDWQEVPTDEHGTPLKASPPGADIRMDFKAGKTYVRRMPATSSDPSANGGAL